MALPFDLFSSSFIVPVRRAISLPSISRRNSGHIHPDHHPPVLFQAVQTGIFYQRPFPQRGKGRNQQPPKTAQPAGVVDALPGRDFLGAGVRPAFHSAGCGGKTR